MEATQRLTHVSIDQFLAQLAARYHASGFSFALWKLPGVNGLNLAATASPEKWSSVTLESAKPGFLFSPFDPAAQKIFVPADESFLYEDEQFRSIKGAHLEKIIGSSNSKNTPEIPKYHVNGGPGGNTINEGDYRNLVQKCREGVIQSTFEKIVPTRCKKIQLPENFDVASMFVRLCNRYPMAMVSVFSSPLTGTWVGATPEMLVSVDRQQHFHTAAVAATQPFVPGTDLAAITWTQKDIEEQALVERYIISCFKKIRLREFDEHGPKTVVAGNVVHLKTEFEVDMVATRFPQLGTVMLQLLHPTSAVCGMPLEASLAFLKSNEGYDRQFYSGFLGPVNITSESHLFVNLRCMQLFGEAALVYAGAGVLGASDPEKEWKETELKMDTLLQAIRQ